MASANNFKNAFHLKGKNVVVTGSTSGIGEGIARGFAAAGANLLLNGFGKPEVIEDLRTGLERDYGITAHYSPADMSKGDEIVAMIRDAEQQLGSIDILVNNAGIQHVDPIEDFPPEKWDAIIAINLSASFHTIRAALPGMKKRNWGRIINIASAHGLRASPFKSAYVAAKHGLVGLTKTVALETAETEITCNAICPGYVKTPLVEGQIADQAKAHDMSEEQVIRDVILEAQPDKRFVEIDEIHGLAIFLCSDYARSITGAALSIDGGWTAR